MPMDYYYFPTSYWSRNVSLVLAEKGLEPARHVVDIRNNATFDPDYIRMNPRGVVPTLVDDGEVIWDGPTIAKYLDGKAGPQLCRYEDSEVADWVHRLDAVPVMLFSYSVWIRGERGENSANILTDKIERAKRYAAEYPDLRERYERKRVFFEDFYRQVHDPDHVAKQRRQCAALLDEMGVLLQDRVWLAGDELSFGDCIAVSMLYRLADLGERGGLAHWHDDEQHGLHGYFDRLRQRPSFREVFVDDERIPA